MKLKERRKAEKKSITSVPNGNADESGVSQKRQADNETEKNPKKVSFVKLRGF